MKMEVKIHKKGRADGTIGWLARGLEEGTITLVEGQTKGGAHGLFFRSSLANFTLAFYAVSGRPRYDVYLGRYTGDEYESYFTSACYRTLHTIAEKWCEMMNQELHQEKEISEIQVVRIQISPHS